MPSSIFKICERCGEYYKDNEDIELPTEVLGNFSTSKHRTTWYSLCNKCLDELQVIIRDWLLHHE